MFRRLSVLVRRPTDDREAFASAWKRHGDLIRKLPGVLAYQQNHVVEDFGHSGALPAFDVDGVVELRFESPEAMTLAFASPEARPVKSDEPNFLGHGTGYVIARVQDHREATDGRKLIVIARISEGSDASTTLLNHARQLAGHIHAIRDDVTDVIARPEMARGPQGADMVIHLYFHSTQACRDAGRALPALAIPGAAFSVYRVETLTVI